MISIKIILNILISNTRNPACLPAVVGASFDNNSKKSCFILGFIPTNILVDYLPSTSFENDH